MSLSLNFRHSEPLAYFISLVILVPFILLTPYHRYKIILVDYTPFVAVNQPLFLLQSTEPISCPREPKQAYSGHQDNMPNKRRVITHRKSRSAVRGILNHVRLTKGLGKEKRLRSCRANLMLLTKLELWRFIRLRRKKSRGFAHLMYWTTQATILCIFRKNLDWSFEPDLRHLQVKINQFGWLCFGWAISFCPV